MIRKYVDVICLNDKGGNIKPLFLIWDEKKRIPIKKVTEICPRASLKVGGSGLRYTCVFEPNRTMTGANGMWRWRTTCYNRIENKEGEAI